jgi:hypothetical protein
MDIAAAAAALPGMTRNFGNPPTNTTPVTTLSKIAPLKERKVILLATATITLDNLFSNGLFQNVFILYKMFDAMGYAPILVIHDKPSNLDKIPTMLHPCRMMSTEQIILQPIPVIALIEIGMSIDPLLREFVKMLGGKLAKLYLGNILNIDVETPIFYPAMHFAHHVIEKIDRVWVSPHYGQHAEYASYLNHVIPPENLEDMIAPYVWDSCIVTRDGEQRHQWRPRAAPEDDVIVIMEPNISFQKSSLVPLLTVERWYRASGRKWRGKVVVVNGDRLEHSPHFNNSLKSTLDIFTDGRVELLDRRDILTVMKTWPSALFVLHQYNNEYNYMTLELLHCGFPVVHNSEAWAAFGYTYSGNNIQSGAEQIHAAWSTHAEHLEAYRAHSAALTWRHSPYNPTVQEAWNALLNLKK